MRRVFVFIVSIVCFSAWAEKQPFSRYQSVIDRQMFGGLPPGFDPSKMPSEVVKTNQKELTKEQEQLKSAVHFSVINVMPSGEIEVGFTDSSDKESPTHYFLKVGESQDGWTVEAADKDAATVTLTKGEITLDLSLGDNSAKGGGTAKKAGAASATGGLLGSSSSLRMRRQARLEAETKRLNEEAEKRRAEDERRRAEEKAEREAEREQQRQQLQAIQEELKRAREEKAKAAEGNKEPNNGEDNDAS